MVSLSIFIELKLTEFKFGKLKNSAGTYSNLLSLPEIFNVFNFNKFTIPFGNSYKLSSFSETIYFYFF